MDLRNFATTEASAFTERLIAACDAATQQARTEAQEEIEKVRAEEGAARDAAREAASGAQAEAQRELAAMRERLDAARVEESRLAQALDEESARNALLEQARRQAIQDYTSRLAEAEAAQAAVRSEAHAAEAALMRQAQAMEAALRSELQAAEAARQNEAQAAEAAIRSTTQAAEAAIRSEAQATEAALLTELARAATAVQTLREELQATHQHQQQQDEQIRRLEARLHDADAGTAALGQQTHELEARLRDADATAATIRQQSHEFEARLHEADATAAGLRQRAQELEARLQEAGAAAAAFREQAQEAEAGAAAVRAELSISTETGERRGALLTASVDAIDALATPTKVEDVLRTVVEQLGRQFERSAIFRVRGKHLQGAHGVGIDLTLDVTKLMIPMSIDSVMTRALASGAAECLHGEQLADLRPPFGGTPVSALAIPIIFARDTLAVLYADSQTALTDAHLVFATLIARHTTVVLARLAQELKAARELREYAQSLLEEAEQMFVSDLDAGQPGPERVRRLRSSIAFARQLFDHRTALERAGVPGLLDEQIAAIVAAEPARPFSRDLALAIEQPDIRRASAS